MPKINRFRRLNYGYFFSIRFINNYNDIENIMLKPQKIKIDNNNENLAEEALQWIVTLSSGEATHEDIERCQNWKKISRQHQEAFEKARILWLSMGNSNQLSIYSNSSKLLPTFSSEALYILHTYKYFFILAFSLIIYTSSLFLNQSDMETTFGEIQNFSLIDESEITLNTHTAVDFDIKNSNRILTLKYGEVFLKTSKKKENPFIVYASDNLIKVNGAKFNIQITHDSTIITAIEGSLIVRNSEIPEQILKSNQKITINKNKKYFIEDSTNQNVTSWLKGYLQFNNVRVQDILNVIENYDQRFWIIQLNNEKSNIRLNTTLQTHNIDNWLIGLASILSIQVKKIGKIIIIYD